LITDALAAHEDALVYLAIVLAAIGWVYRGFARADGRASAIAVQAGSAVVFLNVAFFGAQHDPSCSWVSGSRARRVGRAAPRWPRAHARAQLVSAVLGRR
jgi:hypothetical protein